MAVPVLVLCFHRARQLSNLLNSLASYPGRVYVSQDRPAIEGTASDMGYRATRDVIAHTLDSVRDVRVVPRPDEHLGLKRSIEVAVSYAFSVEEEVIVLEDDVLPYPNFFPFVEEANARYATDRTVGHVSGYNYVPVHALSQPEAAARISAIPHTLAMLLRRTWVEAYRSDLSDWRDWLEPSCVLDITGSRVVARNWIRAFDRVATGQADSWAISWSASMWAVQRWALTSNRNHIQYDGYEGGTHSNPVWKELAPGDLSSEWSLMGRDARADNWEFKHGFEYDLSGTAKRYAGIAVRRAGNAVSSLRTSKFLKG